MTDTLTSASQQIKERQERRGLLSDVPVEVPVTSTSPRSFDLAQDRRGRGAIQTKSPQD